MNDALPPGAGTKRDVRVLLLEDSALDADLVEAQLLRGGLRPRITRVWTREDYQEAISAGDFDIILADHVLPRFDGDTALEMANAQVPHVPFIFVSGTLGEELAVAALKRGATDFVVKQRLHRLPDVVCRAIEEAHERNERRRTQEALGRSEAQLRLIIDSAVDYLIVTTDPHRRITAWSHGAALIFGYSEDEVLGQKIDLIFTPEDIAAGQPQREVDDARETGCGTDERWHECKDGSRVYLNGSVHPLAPMDDGTERGFIKIARDETARRQADDALRASEMRLRSITDVVPSFIWFGSADGNIVYFNDRWFDYTGNSADEAMPNGWIETVHPDDRERTAAAWAHALATRTRYEIELRYRRRDGAYRWFMARAEPMVHDGVVTGWAGSSTDIHDRHEAQAKLAESEQRLRAATEAADIGTWDFNPATGELRWDARCRKLFGMSASRPIDYPTFLAGLHPDDREAADQAVQSALSPDGSGEYDIDYRTVGLDDGIERWVSATGRTLFDHGPRGRRARRFIGTVIDITERRVAAEALQDERRRLEILNRSGSALAGELDLERLVQMATDAGVDLTGAEFGAFFYNVVNRAGESYLLYTLSGADRSAFESFGMPRNTAVFHPTFAGQGTVRSEDITQDARYGKSGPHFGMPKGHLPVRSYLAVPVSGRSGEVIGGLFFGHSEPGRFSERHEMLMTGIAAQAAVAMDNARLYQAVQHELEERVRAETMLREVNETLEQRVSDEVARRSQAEEALRQAQKMETLGQLTGGVAHDFNNLLQIVTGNLEIIQRNLPEEESRLRRAAVNAAKGAERAATLTQRLLAFSRRQPLSPKRTELNKLIAGMSDLLHRTLGETTEVETVLAPRLWPVEIDANQLENAILNLAVNARDAMPEGGKLTIETQNSHLDESYTADNAEVAPGQYVMVCVSDTGSGMDEDTVARAFEPFFTTKDVGKGTGLGLSMVYGFVKQSGGHLKIYSELGEGTTVRLYLPRLTGTAATEEFIAEEVVPEGSREELILVCEDDDQVRAYSAEALRELGYRVIEAADGTSALRAIEQHDGRIDLLFTDVVLPGGMTGAVLAQRARELRPDLKVLFTTGYARNAIVHHGRLDAGVELLTKPFTYAALAAKIRAMLD
jgi:PAS domain S-box-containing protein